MALLIDPEINILRTYLSDEIQSQLRVLPLCCAAAKGSTSLHHTDHQLLSGNATLSSVSCFLFKQKKWPNDMKSLMMLRLCSLPNVIFCISKYTQLNQDSTTIFCLVKQTDLNTF